MCINLTYFIDRVKRALSVARVGEKSSYNRNSNIHTKIIINDNLSSFNLIVLKFDMQDLVIVIHPLDEEDRQSVEKFWRKK